jgi:polysaccharide biosynthesis/export protein
MNPQHSGSHRVGMLILVGLFALLCMLFGSPAAAQAPATPATGSAPAPVSATEYRLGAGDAVRISVYQSPDLTLEARISEAGVVSYPLLGNVKIGGMSVSAAEKLIADGLKNGNFVKAPQVSVLVTQVRGNQVSVLGQVNRPGRFPIEAPDLRLSDLLAIAGGVAISGADTVILVGTRSGQRIRKEIELASLFRSANVDDDMLVQNGDVVYVERAPIVYIYGEVQRPGPMRLERGLTVMQALATGGGLTVRGTERGLRLHRKGGDGKLQVLQPAMDDVLVDGDVVYVRESLF